MSSWAYESLICNHLIVWLLGDDSFCSGALNVFTGIKFSLFSMHKLFITYIYGLDNFDLFYVIIENNDIDRAN